MASNIEFVEYICDQCKDAGIITYRKMFGEYSIYCDGKIIGLICDNQFFLKPTDMVKPYLKEIIMEPPYQGAKPAFLIESVSDSSYLSKIVELTYQALPDKKLSPKQ